MRHCGDCGREVGRYFQYCDPCERKRRLKSYARYGNDNVIGCSVFESMGAEPDSGWKEDER